MAARQRRSRARTETPRERARARWRLAAAPLRAWDLMGNPQDAAGATIDEYPVYTLSAER